MQIDPALAAEFLREYESGEVSPETLARLAAQAKGGRSVKPGPKLKVDRRLEALMWLYVAEDKCGWKRKEAYEQLSRRRLCREERHVKRMIAQAKRIDHLAMIFDLKEVSMFFCAVFLCNMREIFREASGAKYGMNINVPVRRKVKEGKDAFLFLFEKSEFLGGRN